MRRLFVLALVVAGGGCSNEQGFSSDLKADGLPISLPFAVVQGVPLGHIDEALVIDGTASYDPDDEDAELLYTWEVVSAPADADYTLNYEQSGTPEFKAATLGEYELGLFVTDEDTYDSENPAGVIIEVVPWEDLKIDLQWDLTGVDLDLHLIGPEGEYFGESDCFYGNPSPDWGVEGDSTDNPNLAIDDEGSNLTETILLERPEQGVYSIGVHYVNSKESTTYSTDPMIRITAGGSEVVLMTGTALTEPGEVLIVGTLDWTTLTFDSLNNMSTQEDLGGPPLNQ
jgi:hypothetical protein